MKTKTKNPKKETPEMKLGGLIALLLDPAIQGEMPEAVAKDVYDAFKFGWVSNDKFDAQTLLDAVKEYLVKVGA